MSGAGYDYVPLDAQLALPRVRILRALRWHDEATLADLIVALGSHDVASYAMGKALSRAVADGLVHRRGGRNMARYSITTRGRSELKRVNRRAEIGRAISDRYVNS